MLKNQWEGVESLRKYILPYVLFAEVFCCIHFCFVHICVYFLQVKNCSVLFLAFCLHSNQYQQYQYWLAPMLLRCQTLPSIWALGEYKPVIPGVPLIRWAKTSPRCVSGSVWSTFVSAGDASLTVKQAYSILCTNPVAFWGEPTFHTPPLLFRRRPPQSNSPSYTVHNTVSIPASLGSLSLFENGTRNQDFCVFSPT